MAFFLTDLWTYFDGVACAHRILQCLIESEISVLVSLARTIGGVDGDSNDIDIDNDIEAPTRGEEKLIK